MNSRLVAAGDGVVVDIAVGAVHESDTAVVSKKSTIAEFSMRIAPPSLAWAAHVSAVFDAVGEFE